MNRPRPEVDRTTEYLAAGKGYYDLCWINGELWACGQYIHAEF